MAVVALTREIGTRGQEVAAGLRPLALDDLGLAAALEGGTAGGTGK